MRNNVLLTTIVFFLLCGVIESLAARHISPSLQNRLTIVIFFLLGVGLTLAALVAARDRLGRSAVAGWPFLAFGALAVASTAWSSMPTATFLASAALVFLTFACVSLCALSDWRTLIKGVTLACAAIGVLSLILIPVGGLMTEIHEGALRGPFGEKNRAGMVYAIGGLSAGGLAFINRKPGWLALIPFFLVLLFMSKSGTSTIACALGLAGLAYCELLRGRPGRLVLGTWFGVLGCIAFFSLVVLNAETILNLVGEDATFTGRDKIWPAVLWRIQESPWLGYGYDGFWREDSGGVVWLWYEVGFEVYNAHNGWLETMLAVGIPGAVLLGWASLRTLTAGLAGLYFENDARRIALPMIAMILMMSMTESAIGGADGPAWVLFLLIGVKAAMGLDREGERLLGRNQRRFAARQVA